MPSGTGFVNWDDYFNLNKQSAQQTANNVAGNLQGQMQSANQNLQNIGAQFDEAAAAGNHVPAQAPKSGPVGVAGSYAPGPKNGGTNAGGRQGAGDDNPGTTSTAYTHQNPDGTWSANQFSYNGPTGLTDAQISSAKQQYGQAGAAIQATGSLEGLQSNLQNMYGAQGGYSQGSSLFDAALSGQADPGTFAALRAKYADLYAPVDALVARAKATADKYAADAAANQATANDQAAGQNLDRQTLPPDEQAALESDRDIGMDGKPRSFPRPGQIRGRKPLGAGGIG